MTPTLLAVTMVGGLLLAALLGPWAVRRAAPSLARAPRTAVALLSGAVLVWVATLLAVGPLLAWLVSGPVLLSGQAAEVCQRCLAAANPFAASPVDTAAPAAGLVVLSSAAAVLMVGAIWRDLLHRRRRTRGSAQWLLADAESRTVQGHQVSLFPSESPFAVAFPASQGGIVLSTGALQLLDEGELAAVLAHEKAHLGQRHHLVSDVLGSVAKHLRWVPLIAAVVDVLPQYLEIAADHRACRRAGTTALVSALVKLGDPSRKGEHHMTSRRAMAPGGGLAPPMVGVLHAAGPERIRQLVAPVGGMAGAVPAVAIMANLVVLGLVSAVVYLPYAWAVLSGCL
ncbi:MAG TPA: M56 family metallopeptidase [Ornithinicoccus sp.]|nr:M56 family metallopeptidase [Ornithinicoccus sp.]